MDLSHAEKKPRCGLRAVALAIVGCMAIMGTALAVGSHAQGEGTAEFRLLHAVSSPRSDEGENGVMWSITSSSTLFDSNTVLREIVVRIRNMLPYEVRSRVNLSSRITRWEPDYSELLAVSEANLRRKGPSVTLLVALQGLDEAVIAGLDRAIHSPHALSSLNVPSLSVVRLPFPHGTPLLMGYVDGLQARKRHNLRVVLTSPDAVVETEVNDDGVFAFQRDAFHDMATGEFYFSVRGKDYFFDTARKITFESTQVTQVVLTRVRPILARVPQSSYMWKADGTLSGRMVMSGYAEHVDPLLKSTYAVSLAGEDWTLDYATRVRRSLDQIPLADVLGATTWALTPHHVNDDIEVNGDHITISMHAFRYAAPWVEKRPAQSFFSKRLYMACVRFVIDNVGKNDKYHTEAERRRERLSHILERRFGVVVSPEDINYSELTKGTTNEDESAFQPFHADELIALVTMFEAMPSGLHKLENLHTLARRVSTHKHPDNPLAAAMSWPGNGYIEFMESTFRNSVVEDSFRLILHEKAHFLYADANLITPRLREEWARIGEWVQVGDTWITTNEEQFVSFYAHLLNPDEDFAESLATYIRLPERLRRLAPSKYAFIRDNIAHGTQYSTVEREDLVFQVFNLWPDAVNPGIIEKLTITVRGSADQDKTVHIVITLANDVGKEDGASRAYLALRHSTEPVTHDMMFQPRLESGDDQETSHVLEASLQLSRHAPSGDWTTDQIVISDPVGNERYAHVSDLGWQCVINNAHEYRSAPVYVPESFSHTIERVLSKDGKRIPEQLVKVQWKMQDRIGLGSRSACYAALVVPDDEVGAMNYGLNGWGHGQRTREADLYRCTVEFRFRDFHQSGKYSVGLIMMENIAGYTTLHEFDPTEDPVGGIAPLEFVLATEAPDRWAPVIDTNSITIGATAHNSAEPDGETDVEFSFHLCDVGSAGVAEIAYSFIDPSDDLTFGYITMEDNAAVPDVSDDRNCATYTKKHTLPVGSQPGYWALHGLEVYDNARNVNHYTFTQVVFKIGATGDQA